MNKKSRHLTLTASAIRAYKSCPRLYELQYLYQLKPIKTPAPLAIGSGYHGELEKLFTGEPVTADTLPGIMATAFDKFIPWQEWSLAAVEEEFNLKLTPFLRLRGKLDGRLADGTPVEHKTAGGSISEDTAAGLKYVDQLARNDQVSVYLLATRKTRMKYTVVQKPTIRQKQGETESEFLSRCAGWYDPSKVRTFDVTRTPEQLEETEREIRLLASEIRRRRHFFRNPSHCLIMSCPFEAVCLSDDLDADQLTGFVQKNSEHEELTKCEF